MPYTSPIAGLNLTAEERDVAAALAGYTAAQATPHDSVPTAALWRAYRDWWDCHRWRHDPEALPRLTVRQFGRAVRRLFAGIRRYRRSRLHSITQQIERFNNMQLHRFAGE